MLEARTERGSTPQTPDPFAQLRVDVNQLLQDVKPRTDWISRTGIWIGTVGLLGLPELLKRHPLSINERTRAREVKEKVELEGIGPLDVLVRSFGSMSPAESPEVQIYPGRIGSEFLKFTPEGTRLARHIYIGRGAFKEVDLGSVSLEVVPKYRQIIEAVRSKKESQRAG